MIRALFSAACLLALVLIVRACAPKPPPLLPCPVPAVDAYETPAGMFYVFDQANMDKLVARMEGLRDRTCIGLPAPDSIPDGGAAS